MAKGIPLMGRGPDGKAKVINVDENGNVKVQQSGANVLINSGVDFEVAPGSASPTHVDSYDYKNFTWLYVRVLAQSEHDFEVEQEVPGYTRLKIAGKTIGSIIFFSDPFRPLGTAGRIWIKNMSSDPQKYNFQIYGMTSGNGVSPATDAKLEQVKSELELVKSELEAIKANQLSGDQKVRLSGTLGARQVIVQESAADLGIMTGLRVTRDPASRVEVPNNGLYTFNTGLSFEMEFYSVSHRYSSFFWLYDVEGNQRSVKLEYFDLHNCYRLFASEDGVNFARFDTARDSAPFVPRQFTELALTWEFGSNPVLYVNKTPYPMTLEYGTMPSSLFATSAPLCIGFDPGYITERNFNGLIRNIRLWKDVVRSHEQVNQPITGDEPGLVGYWKADEGEGTILTDSSPNANHGTITIGSWESVALGVLRPDEYREMYQTDQPVIIDELVWGAVGAEAQEGAELQIEIDGVPWRVTGQGEFLPITPKAINDSYALEWNIFAYDTTTHVYKFGLRSPLVCPNGCVIRIGNRGQGNVGSWIIRVIGREAE